MQTADLNNHSAEMQQIISAPPSWLMKWGISVFVTVLFILGLLSYFIRYPDTVKVRLVTYRSGSSKPVASAVDGRIEAWLAPADGRVEAGQPLLYLQAPISHQAVNALYERALTLRSSGATLQPGDLKALRSTFHALFHADPPPDAGWEQRNSSGYQLLTDLTGAIKKWKERYQVHAAATGQINTIRPLYAGRSVHKGQPLFYLTGSKPAGNFYGEVRIPQKDISRIKKGQQVVIRLDRYDHQDFGLLRGTLSDIATLPESDSIYIANVQIYPPGNRQLVLQNGLGGEADIITQDISLMKRLTNSINRSLLGR